MCSGLCILVTTTDRSSISSLKRLKLTKVTSAPSFVYVGQRIVLLLLFKISRIVTV